MKIYRTSKTSYEVYDKNGVFAGKFESRQEAQFFVSQMYRRDDGYINFIWPRKPKVIRHVNPDHKS